MNMEKTVMERLVSASIQREKYLAEHRALGSQTIQLAILNEILELRHDIQSLSTAITSATSSSGTETEDSPLPTEKHGS